MNRIRPLLPLLILAASSGCGLLDPDRSLVVEGRATLDGEPVPGIVVRLVGVTFRYVSDTSIQGYHYDQVDTPLGRASTGEDGSYRLEVTRSGDDCEASAFVRLTFGAVQTEVPVPSQCGSYSGIDAVWTTRRVVGSVRLNGAPVGGTVVELGETCTGLFQLCDQPVLDSTVSDADGGFALLTIDCRPDQAYFVRAELDEGFFAYDGFEGCVPERTVALEASTLVEVFGEVRLDGAPAVGWIGQIVGPAESCNLFTDVDCPELVLASAVTDSAGTFELSHLAEGYQCPTLYLRAVPPDDWAGPVPEAVNPPASGWERGCGSHAPAFEFVTPT